MGNESLSERAQGPFTSLRSMAAAGQMRPDLSKGLRRIALPAAILVIWQVMSSAGLVSAASLPSPYAVIIAWWHWIFGARQALGSEWELGASSFS